MITYISQFIKTRWPLLCVAAAIIAAFSMPFPGVRAPGAGVVRIGEMTVHVTIARTVQEQERGLGGRQGLQPDEGMLFVFDEPAGPRPFWMKDMRFAIDIIWLAADGTVTDIAQSVQPDSFPAVLDSRRPAQDVLEVSAGFAAGHGLHEGDHVTLPAGM